MSDAVLGAIFVASARAPLSSLSLCQFTVHELPGDSIFLRGVHVAQWSARRNSNLKTLGSIPCRGMEMDSICIPPSQLWCRLVRLCLTHHPPPPPQPPPWCARHTPRCVRTLKIPYSYVVKEYASQQVVWIHETLHTGGEKKLVSAALWLLAFPGQRNPPFQALH